MCGIVGILGSVPSTGLEEAIRGMASRLRHRGPDSSGHWVDLHAQVALGHTRLAIIDCSAAGNQPMHSHCGRYVLTYNGEIYNHLDARRALERDETIAWRGHSDTETLVECLARWGLDRTLESIEGMFAFALWDRKERELVLARDRFGEKPIYYGVRPGLAFFASELKAFAGIDASASVNREAVAALLRYGYIPSPMSILRGVGKLEAGHLVRIRSGLASVPVAYWDPLEASRRARSGSAPSGLDDAIERVDGALRASVRAQLISDVPLGAFLSGGIDSSLVVAMMQAEGQERIRTFTIGFEEERYDESMHAAVVSRHLGTQHTCVTATPTDALSIVPQLAGIYCEPFADSSQIPTILVSRIAAAHVKVALSGDGADEIFGGYNSYQFLPRLAALSRLPRFARRGLANGLGALPRSVAGANEARLRRLRRVLLADGPSELMDSLQVHWDFAGRVVLSEDGASASRRFPAPAFPGDLVSSMMLADLGRYLPDDVLVKVDRASMSTSLETRAPFLSRRVFEAAWSLPASLKIQPGMGKFVLRKLLSRYVPQEIVDRPKKGFSVPVAQWLRGPLREWAGWLLDPARIAAQGILDGRPVGKLWEEHLSGTSDHADRLWPVLMFQAWLEENSAR